jgi:hypothetical protein
MFHWRATRSNLCAHAAQCSPETLLAHMPHLLMLECTSSHVLQFQKLVMRPPCGHSRGLTAHVSVPKGLLAAWFPGAPLPLDVSLQLEVDGHPWGDRFDSRITKSFFMGRGCHRFPELDGCHVTAFRRALGPAALDLVVSSLPGPGDSGEIARLGVCRQLEPQDLEPNAWPVVRASVTCVCGQ